MKYLRLSSTSVCQTSVDYPPRAAPRAPPTPSSTTMDEPPRTNGEQVHPPNDEAPPPHLLPPAQPQRSSASLRGRGGHSLPRPPSDTDADGYVTVNHGRTKGHSDPSLNSHIDPSEAPSLNPNPKLSGSKHVSFSAPSLGPLGASAADVHLLKRVSPINPNSLSSSDPKQLPSDTPTHSSAPKTHPVPAAFNAADFKQLSIIFALRPSDSDSQLEIYTDTFLPAFFQALIDYLTTLAPHDIFSNSWTLGLKYGIGPFPITPDQKDFLIQSIYVINFNWPASSTITEQEVSGIFKTLSSSEITEVTLPVRTCKKKAPASTIKDDEILFDICFSTTIQGFSSFVKKGKSTLSYQFSISLPDNCPDHRVSLVLCFIAEFLLDRKIDPSEASINSLFSRQQSPFDKVKHQHPRLLNNFRLLLEFDRQESVNDIACFHRACDAHKEHRSKRLLPADTHDCKIKNASFGYISEQRGKSNTRNPIAWMLREYEKFLAQNPFMNESTSASASSDASRDPRNPWKSAKPPLPLLADRVTSTRIRAPNKPPVDADNESEDLEEVLTEYGGTPARAPDPVNTPTRTLNLVDEPHTTFLSSLLTIATSNTVGYTPLIFDVKTPNTPAQAKHTSSSFILCLSHILNCHPADLHSYFKKRALFQRQIDYLHNENHSLRSEWKTFTHFHPIWNSNFPGYGCPGEPASEFPDGNTEPEFLHLLSLAPTNIRSLSIFCIEIDCDDLNLSLESPPVNSSIRPFFIPSIGSSDPEFDSHSHPTAIILCRKGMYSTLTLNSNTATTPTHSTPLRRLLSSFPHIAIAHYTTQLPPYLRLTPLMKAINCAFPLDELQNIANGHSPLLLDIQSSLDHSKLPHSPPAVETSFPFTIQCGTNVHKFVNNDFGQHIRITNNTEEVTHSNCCLLLCLAAAANLTPSSLATYFCCKAQLLRDANAMLSDERLANTWRTFVNSEQISDNYKNQDYLHLVASFPQSSSWAGSFALNTILDIDIISLLSPTEIRNTPILIFQDQSSTSNVVLSLPKASNSFAYFPPLDPATINRPVLILQRSHHYTILRPTNPNSVTDLIASLCPCPRHRHPIRQNPRDAISFIELINAHSRCDDIGALYEQHELYSELHSTRLRPVVYYTHSQSPAHTSSQNPSPAADHQITMVYSQTPPPARETPGYDPGAELLQPSPSQDTAVIPDPLSPSPLPGTKRPTSSTDIISPEITQNLARNRPSASPPSSAVEDLSLTEHSATSESASIHSSTDLTDLVRMQGRRGESIFQPPIYVRGQNSSDESSELTGSCPASADPSTSSSNQSFFSTGSFHHHAVPRGFPIPICSVCRRQLQFGLFHNDNHRCDVFLCLLPSIPTGSFGWHCAHCSIDHCIICYPITWVPISSISTLNSLAADSFDNPPSQLSLPSTQIQASGPLSSGNEAAA